MNLEQKFFKYVERGDKVIVANVIDCNDRNKSPVDCLAEVPRRIIQNVDNVVARVDTDRIFGIGWSAGAGALARGLCSSNQLQYDSSEFGTTSDVYAGIASIGGCVGCVSAARFEGSKMCGNFHYIAVNGADDQFGGNGCLDAITNAGGLNACSHVDATFCPIPENDLQVPGFGEDYDINDLAVRRIPGTCEGGDVVSYRFSDEGHELNFDEHWNPKIRSDDMVWQFLITSGRSRYSDPLPIGGTLCGQGSQTDNTLSRGTTSCDPIEFPKFSPTPTPRSTANIVIEADQFDEDDFRQSIANIVGIDVDQVIVNSNRRN
eukprot:CAMPEP_0201558302 /NCGR_PEP_ID=MMETSP0173_2-20130828/67065_1 /ASSEMBLY_ACC=CAM_ASM_000268 /TAXON_ID=218659 /ORGANISM="Vexillifera sp., Strain DIVA3 564/2" /LENGTH=318 /DNA_ID=CAMNT_0047971649 /DNA_START=10 /DNA_END=963 /DNA_ORIENTATION=+